MSLNCFEPIGGYVHVMLDAFGHHKLFLQTTADDLPDFVGEQDAIHALVVTDVAYGRQGPHGGFQVHFALDQQAGLLVIVIGLG